ncbi:MAG: hypothetical protein FJ011_14250 [Chloroflexi bacterium]|nr:hypothetical protein [Chloroflexota bacterium]
MLPTAHIEVTWATLNLLQRKRGLFLDADYRLMALAALAPDVLDKPLALTLYRNTDAALFWGHNLWLHLAVWAAAWAWSRRQPAGAPFSAGRRSSLTPYLLAFSGHLVADRMWGFQESLFYPIGAGYWHPWVHVGKPAAMLDAYLEIVRTTPILLVFESLGLALLAWLVWDRGLWRRPALAAFLLTGRPPVAADAGPRSPAPTTRPAASRFRPILRWLFGWLLR